MKKDAGMFTDATGEGMSGSTDTSFDTQKALKTIYNGSKNCQACGCDINPYEALLSELCPTCSRRKSSATLKNRMSE